MQHLSCSQLVCRGGEMVDALALGASEATHGGSSPLPGTKLENLFMKVTDILSRKTASEAVIGYWFTRYSLFY